MTDDADTTPPIADLVIPFSEIGSVQAPILFFEDASAFGHLNAVFRITLETTRLFAIDPGKVATDRIAVAHLRMNKEAALSLRAAIDGALLLASKPSSEAKN